MIHQAVIKRIQESDEKEIGISVIFKADAPFYELFDLLKKYEE